MKKLQTYMDRIGKISNNQQENVDLLTLLNLTAPITFTQIGFELFNKNFNHRKIIINNQDVYILEGKTLELDNVEINNLSIPRQNEDIYIKIDYII